MLIRTQYEQLIYTLPARYPSICLNTLVLVPPGLDTARLTGLVAFDDDLVLYWYDSWPHPNDPTLAATHPHHKHIPPDIKHHRIPAPDLSFTRPNLPILIAEIERELIHL